MSAPARARGVRRRVSRAPARASGARPLGNALATDCPRHSSARTPSTSRRGVQVAHAALSVHRQHAGVQVPQHGVVVHAHPIQLARRTLEMVRPGSALARMPASTRAPQVARSPARRLGSRTASPVGSAKRLGHHGSVDPSRSGASHAAGPRRAAPVTTPREKARTGCRPNLTDASTVSSPRPASWSAVAAPMPRRSRAPAGTTPQPQPRPGCRHTCHATIPHRAQHQATGAR